ncbi:MAG TPA: hypothetical protein VET26_09400 [Candidatus Sulfotelmatobacter sp.]|nr:hypothetical protein [Candidatus Sulfotelmatobacter sp.]
MEAKTMLDKISTAIERVVKDLQGGAVPKKKRMRLGEFVSYALAQISKATKDEPEVAKRRLGALKRNVDEVLAAMAKLNPEDTESEDIDVEVLTAWAPSKAEGDEPEEELTTADDQSSTERSPLAVEPALGNTAFAENLDEVAKALRKMKEELEAKPGKKGRAPAKKAEGEGWPLDLNSEGFRKGVQKADAAPAWGYDPEGVASPKAG